MGARSCAVIGLFVLGVLHSSADVRIEILRGNGTNNNAIRGASIAPAVRVLDSVGQPIRGALVVFTAPQSGASVTFGQEGFSAQGLTDEAGVVVAPSVRPVGDDGPVAIQVVVSQGGQFFNAVIHEMNLGVKKLTASQELDLLNISEPEPEPHSPPGVHHLRVRVEDGVGRPVPMATVWFVLRRIGSGGKIEEVSQDVTTSGIDGSAVTTIPRKSGNRSWQFMVRAEQGGRRTTAYFTMD